MMNTKIPTVILVAPILFLGASSLLGAPPPNDNFSNRLTLTAGVTATSDSTAATIEPGEPYKDANRTVWYAWTAPSDSMVSVDDIGTQVRYHFIAVYMGDSLAHLATVQTGFNAQSDVIHLSFPAKAGTTFQIQMGGTQGFSGTLSLTLNTNPFPHTGTLYGPVTPVSTRPYNDNFASRTDIAGSALTAIAYTQDATIEGGEPNRPFEDASKTVWFQWTAPANATVSLDTTGTNISRHFFAVYVGDSIQSLSTVAGDYSILGRAATDSFPAIAGRIYQIAVGSLDGSFGIYVLTLTTGQAPAGSLLNLSTRAQVGVASNVMIAGFIVTGSAKRLALRGIGPSLAAAGVRSPLMDPAIELRNSNGALIAQNNDWQQDAQQAGEIQAAGLAPKDSRESALIATLSPGSYTAITQGVNASSGVGLVEVYDLEGAGAVSKAANVSTRAQVLTGNSVMIAGFIVGGDGPAHVVIRGIGPSLTGFGIANALQNPFLELYDSNGHRLATNDNWQDAANFGQVVDAGLAPSDSRESALSVILNPSSYTAVVSGLNSTTGVGLVEVYRIQ